MLPHNNHSNVTINPKGKRMHTRGFTLIELVAVIVILGILATATSKFLIFGTQIYVDSSQRQKVLSQSRFIVERITREIRNAIPNSIRVSSDNRCVEFIPIKASGTYRKDSFATPPPIAPNSGNAIDVVSFNGTYVAGDRLYIYGLQSSHFYIDSDRYAIINSIDNSNAPELSFTFSQNVSYAQDSQIGRYFTADHSVVYCLDQGNLYRLRVNNISATLSNYFTVSVLGVLMAEGLTNTITTERPFSYSSGVLFRNSVFNLYLEFAANENENMFFNQEVHIPNVP